MSTKRARWNGSEDIRVFDPEASIYDGPIDTVVPGGLLSADAPARIRDELLKRPDWTEFNQADQTAPAVKTEEKK
jgi:hypothetical protein